MVVGRRGAMGMAAGLVLLWGSAALAVLKDGDVVFQTSRSAQSRAIQEASHSRFSHVGVILHRNGKPFVFEAGPKVRYTAWKQWVAQGEEGHYVVKRLRDASAVFTPEGLTAFRELAATYVGRPYDEVFAWSDERFYCSELVWKLYDRGVGVRLGRLRKLKDFDLTIPLVAAKLKERYGAKVPLEETVVSPGDLFSFEQLVEVEKK